MVQIPPDVKAKNGEGAAIRRAPSRFLICLRSAPSQPVCVDLASVYPSYAKKQFIRKTDANITQ